MRSRLKIGEFELSHGFVCCLSETAKWHQIRMRSDRFQELCFASYVSAAQNSAAEITGIVGG
jgi:hypothetical protein